MIINKHTYSWLVNGVFYAPKYK